VSTTYLKLSKLDTYQANNRSKFEIEMKTKIEL